MTQMSSAYDSLFDIGAIDIDGHVINKLRDLTAGKKATLVVNVATQSPMADFNFKALNELYDRYEQFGFEILAFPCNQFHKQEPTSEHDIKTYIQE